MGRLPALAAELVRLKVDVIVTAGGQATRATKQATSAIPVVMTNDPDPVSSGFVANLAHPAGNITGLSTLAPELSGKRLELLGEVIHKLSRITIVGTSTQPGHAQVLKELELAAKQFKVQIQYVDVLKSVDVESAFQAAAKMRADGLLTLTSAILRSQRTQLADLAVKNQLPAIYNDIQFVEAGGLIFYGVGFRELDRHAAIFVARFSRAQTPVTCPLSSR